LPAQDSAFILKTEDKCALIAVLVCCRRYAPPGSVPSAWTSAWDYRIQEPVWARSVGWFFTDPGLFAAYVCLF